MDGQRSPLVGFVLFLALLAGCEGTPSKPSKKPRTNDAGRIVAREECQIPSTNCYKGCFQRDETRYCPSCCFEEFMLCDDEQPYDFERCKTAETSPPLTRPPSKK
ncbi:hypothetical protein [Polyangium sp. y55x31]|uniref:hypothetical protein n=1 Tax=Polyangium sp. y55x31 TaxID=3042688 RepID=UPI002482FF20|nr:hypothetical protein [Polyangium sp. y55x31]MDI1475692.1 hypothetical protein [Polyangium sp. y55x31]